MTPFLPMISPFSLFLYAMAVVAGVGVLGLVLILLYLVLLFVRGAIAGAGEKV